MPSNDRTPRPLTFDHVRDIPCQILHANADAWPRTEKRASRLRPQHAKPRIREPGRHFVEIFRVPPTRRQHHDQRTDALMDQIDLHIATTQNLPGAV